MPSRSALRGVNLELDIQALRHLVARPELGHILWTGAVREALSITFRQLHGDNSFSNLDHAVSLELLLGQIRLLPPLLERLYEQDNDDRAQRLLKVVAEISEAYAGNSDSVDFQVEFVLLLQQAVLQASLQILMKAPREHLQPIYRNAVTLIRDISESCDDSVSTRNLRKRGVRLIKNVAALLLKRDKRAALLEATKFLQKYSPTKTASDLQAQAVVLRRELGPNKIRQSYENPTKAPAPATRKARAGKRKLLYLPDDKPDFFSDDSDETSNVTPDNETFRAQVRETVPQVADDYGSEFGSLSSGDTPKPPKKRTRMSRAENDFNGHSPRENGDMETHSDTPVSKSRGIRYPEIAHELDGMNSPMFSETRPPVQTVGHVHVVRHAKSRTRCKTRHQMASISRQRRHRRSPTSISQEGASPTHKGGRVYESGVESDGTENLRRDVNRADEDAMERMGREGSVLRALHSNSLKLVASGPSDPLQESVTDARRARRRRNNSDPSYSPHPNVREVSPFPESDDDNGMPRKKVSRLELVHTPVVSRTKQGGGPIAPRPTMTIFGKPCRTGRFEPFEDKLLLKGLEALGWGAWTEIARDFWEGNFIRAPGSLKDRARTIGLTPHDYPKRMELRGRPRLSDYPRDTAGKTGDDRGNDDEDHDEDEEDPIEAPNATPDSENENED